LVDGRDELERLDAHCFTRRPTEEFGGRSEVPAQNHANLKAANAETRRFGDVDIRLLAFGR